GARPGRAGGGRRRGCHHGEPGATEGVPVSRRRNTVRAGVLALVALLAASCGSPGKPVDPAPVSNAAWPQPAHVGGPDATAGGTADTSCNPLASLPASSTSVPDSSTMGDIKRRGQLIAGA